MGDKTYSKYLLQYVVSPSAATKVALSQVEGGEFKKESETNINALHSEGCNNDDNDKDRGYIDEDNNKEDKY